MDNASPMQQFKLRTLTPLWFGNLDHDGCAPRESGLLGSLRFWYEGLLRSYGIDPCNPTGDNRDRCPRPEYCDACQLFGATGHARRFRLEIEGLYPTELFFTVSPAMEKAYGIFLRKIFTRKETAGEGKKDKETFKFPVKPVWSSRPFTITLYARHRDQESTLAKMAFLLQEASQKGGIGAKTQYGFGQVKLELDERVQELIRKGHQLFGDRPQQNPLQGQKFTLHPERFFTLLYKFPSNPFARGSTIGDLPGNYSGQMYVPCAFDIRYKYSSHNSRINRGKDLGLRPAIESRFGERFTQALFGFVRTEDDERRHSRKRHRPTRLNSQTGNNNEGNKAQGSRIHVSHLYREVKDGPYFLKIWGDTKRKDEVVGVIREHLKSRFGNLEEIP